MNYLIGSIGFEVIEIQKIVGVKPDGSYGAMTKMAVIAWQKTHNLPSTGVVDYATWALMFPKLQTINSIKLSDRLMGVLPSATVIKLNYVMALYPINNRNRLIHFLAQCAHESENFKCCEENLNYSAENLLVVFHNYFHDINKAKEFEFQPEKIANHVYANRNGNGGEASGDGYRFRGRGDIQTTGRYNYSLLKDELGVDFITYPDKLAGDYSLLSAAFYFHKNNMWKLCDKGVSYNDIVAVTKLINPGVVGLKDRIEKTDYYNLYV